jgi:hypothetical protein
VPILKNDPTFTKEMPYKILHSGFSFKKKISKAVHLTMNDMGWKSSKYPFQKAKYPSNLKRNQNIQVPFKIGHVLSILYCFPPFPISPSQACVGSVAIATLAEVFLFQLKSFLLSTYIKHGEMKARHLLGK